MDFLHDLAPCFTVWFPYLPRLYYVIDNCIKTCISDRTKLIVAFFATLWMHRRYLMVTSSSVLVEQDFPCLWPVIEVSKPAFFFQLFETEVTKHTSVQYPCSPWYKLNQCEETVALVRGLKLKFTTILNRCY